MKKILLGALFPIGAAMLVSAGEAQAIIFNVNGTDYDVSSTTMSYDDLLATYTLSAFPWFGDEALAKQFAEAATFELGDQYVSFNMANSIYVGALFPHAVPSAGQVTTAYYSLDDSIAGSGDVYGTNSSLLWAYVLPQPPQTAVPGPLPLLGIGAAFSASRQIRRRIKS